MVESQSKDGTSKDGYGSSDNNLAIYVAAAVTFGFMKQMRSHREYMRTFCPALQHHYDNLSYAYSSNIFFKYIVFLYVHEKQMFSYCIFASK